MIKFFSDSPRGSFCFCLVFFIFVFFAAVPSIFFTSVASPRVSSAGLTGDVSLPLRNSFSISTSNFAPSRVGGCLRRADNRTRSIRSSASLWRCRRRRKR